MKYKQTKEHIQKRILATKKTKAEKYPNGISTWNKGLTKENNPIMKIISEKNRINNTEKKQSKYTIEKRRKKLKGKTRTLEQRQHYRESKLGKKRTAVIWNKGLTKHIDKRVKKNAEATSQGVKARYQKNPELKKAISKRFKNKKQNIKHIQKRVLKLKGQKRNNEFKNKQRERNLNRILKQGKFIAFNEKSIPFFNKINKRFNMKALFGKNEFKCMGYSLDFYSKEFNLVIEWNEEHHYEWTTKRLTEKHLTRQNNIKKHLHCKFINIRQKTFNEYSSIEKVRKAIFPKIKVYKSKTA